ncbi:hypothetical protein CV102_24035 [Natronococcus pandeyae]|uniref:DUF7978 domain-containing protein n=1 Tax=Natronococcus pandeyae TaxID=2055836 RepID=A0A8J8Q2U6_9EURY|nr:hypothetical protein [Natronococcus pandeyae]TYL36105.1 hypothetical protein CV102_24035 [Natronococcus pandeyae]
MNSRQINDLPVVGGAGAGFGAWLLGYAITYVLVAPEIRESPLNRFLEAFEGDPATYEMVGWVFYNAHFVTTVFHDLPLIGSHTTTFIGNQEGFSVLLYALPVGLLLASGLALARYHRAATPTQGALVSMTILPGYLVLSVAGAFLFEVSIAGATGGPDLLPAVFLSGIVYPLLFAGIGGATAGALEARES